MKPHRRTRRTIRVPQNCDFCNNKTEPQYTDIETLKHFISERGKILAHTRTGICSKHQRRVGREIKHARFLGSVSFVSRG